MTRSNLQNFNQERGGNWEVAVGRYDDHDNDDNDGDGDDDDDDEEEEEEYEEGDMQKFKLAGSRP